MKYAFAFSHGKTLASGNFDSTIILWNVSPRCCIEQSFQRAGRNFARAEWGTIF
jgi:hypothetical protein